jgi:hypothetical protein
VTVVDRKHGKVSVQQLTLSHTNLLQVLSICTTASPWQINLIYPDVDGAVQDSECVALVLKLSIVSWLPPGSCACKLTCVLTTFVLTVMRTVSPVKYTDLSVVTDRERYAAWKAALLGTVSSPAKVAFLMIVKASPVMGSNTVAEHGATAGPVVNKPNTRIAIKISITNLIISLHLLGL